VSAKENKKVSATQSKTDRAAAMRAEREAAERRGKRWNYAIAGLAVVVVAGLVALALTMDKDSDDVEIAGLSTFDDVAADHTEQPVEYEQTPPVGGMHSEVLLNCGIYSEPVPNENAVHSLEHGAVWITYDPSLADEDVADLREYVTDLRNSVRQYVVVSPYEGLPAPVIASAWARQVQLDGVSDERLGQFIDQFVRGTQSPEPGAPCSGGVGTPDDA
jgi:hypothetical protein